MAYRIKIEGQRYGRLVVMSRESGGKLRCQCDCGKITFPSFGDVRRVRAKSCGCLVRGARGITTLEAATYNSWKSARARCLNPNTPQFFRYGGRGITMCDRWVDSFENFLIDMGRRPHGTTLDRIDYDGNYEPNNCRWATIYEQANNQPLNIRIAHDGEDLTIAQWSRKTGIERTTIKRRLDSGLPPHLILSPHHMTKNKPSLKLRNSERAAA